MTTMQVWFANNGRTETGELTNERAESSYGQPVLVINGVAHGYGDMPVALSWQHPDNCVAEREVCTEEQMRLRGAWNRQALGDAAETEVDVMRALNGI